MLDIDAAHEDFIQYHVARRSGERLGRLQRGHAHAEQQFAKRVWWPLKGSFDLLHPEYEVLDWRGRSFFADFVYDPEYCKLVIEIKGYQEHVTNMDRVKYCRELNRETFLTCMGYRVISFAYDDVANRPELCIQLLRMVLSRFEVSNIPSSKGYFLDREIVRCAIHWARPIRPIDLVTQLEMNHRTAVSHLKRLSDQGWFRPIKRGSGQRVLYYEITRKGLDEWTR